MRNETQVKCSGRGMGFDASSGLCVLVDKDDNLVFFDPETGAQTSAPFIAPARDTIIWPVNPTSPGPTGVIMPANPNPAPALGWWDSITGFMAAPGPLGIPVGVYVLIGGAIVTFIVLAQTNSGGKKSTGWF